MSGDSNAWYVGETASILLYFLFNNSVVVPDNLTVETVPGSALQGVNSVSIGSSTVYIVEVKLDSPGYVILSVRASYAGFTDTRFTMVRFVPEPLNTTLAENYFEDLSQTLDEHYSSIMARLDEISLRLSNLSSQVNESLYLLFDLQGRTALIYDVDREILQAINTSTLELEDNQYEILGQLLAINTSMGYVLANLTQLNAKISSILNNTILIETDLGTIQATLDQVNATLTAVANGVAIINTSVGQIMVAINTSSRDIVDLLSLISRNVTGIKATLEELDPVITNINETTVTILTRIGEIKAEVSLIANKTTDILGTLVAVENNTALIKTSLGEVKVNLTLLLGETESIEATLAPINSNVTNLSITVDSALKRSTDINASIDDLSGGVLRLQTNLGYVMANLTALNASVLEANDRLILLNTTLGQIALDIDNLNSLLQNIVNNITGQSLGIEPQASSNYRDSPGRGGVLLLTGLAAVVIGGVGQAMRKRPYYDFEG
ncbi:MAG: hypothetical protein F7C35_09040 [Desulfurococcales archaeon]|nr:hypothetical protein [Desulfurococcales archaeon]